jgi:hypothetical protein
MDTLRGPKELPVVFVVSDTYVANVHLSMWGAKTAHYFLKFDVSRFCAKLQKRRQELVNTYILIQCKHP